MLHVLSVWLSHEAETLIEHKQCFFLVLRVSSSSIYFSCSYPWKMKFKEKVGILPLPGRCTLPSHVNSKDPVQMSSPWCSCSWTPHSYNEIMIPLLKKKKKKNQAFWTVGPDDLTELLILRIVSISHISTWADFWRYSWNRKSLISFHDRIYIYFIYIYFIYLLYIFIYLYLFIYIYLFIFIYLLYS